MTLKYGGVGGGEARVVHECLQRERERERERERSKLSEMALFLDQAELLHNPLKQTK